METIATTHVGRVRKLNEDTVVALLFEPGAPNPWQLDALLIVADGMGGHDAGEVASHLACETARHIFTVGEAPQELAGPQYLRCLGEVMQEINQVVYAAGVPNRDSGNRPGTTLTIGLLRRNEYFIGHVGDSRAYLVRADIGDIEQITSDDSYVAEAVRRGDMSEADARVSPQRHQITKAIGLEVEISPSVYYGHWTAGDILLLCSDGLSEHVDESEVDEVAQEASDLSIACTQLVALANERGGHDNISLAAARNSHSGQNIEMRQAKTLTGITLPSIAIERVPRRNSTTTEPFTATEYSTEQPSEIALDGAHRAANRKARRNRENLLFLTGLGSTLGIVLIGVSLGMRQDEMPPPASQLAQKPPATMIATATTEDATPLHRDSVVVIYAVKDTSGPFAQSLCIRSDRASRVVATSGRNGNNVEASAERTTAFIEIKSKNSFNQLLKGGALLEIADAKDRDSSPEMIRATLRMGLEYSLLYRAKFAIPGIEVARFHLAPVANLNKKPEGGRDASR